MSTQSVAGSNGTASLSRLQVLGEEHPDTLGSLHCLAACLYSQSKHSEAESLFRQALAARQKVGLARVGWGHILQCDRRCSSASFTSHTCAKLLASIYARVGVKKESE